VRILALLGVMAATGAARADAPRPPAPWGIDAVIGGAAESEHTAAGHVGARGWLGRGGDGEPAIALEVTLDVARVPWLSAARELSAAPYSTAIARFRAPGTVDGPSEFPGDYLTFPIEMFAGVLVQGGDERRFGGGSGTAMRSCWRHADGEPTCIGWFGGRATEIRDGVRSFASIAIYLVPIEGVRAGPLRIDARLGAGTASRSRLDVASSRPAELAVSSVFWDAGVRARAGDVDLAVRSGREPHAATDGTLSFDDRVEASAALGESPRVTVSAYVARTRSWTAAAAPVGIVDTFGGELGIGARVAGFDVLARAAVGRSFYPTLDASLPEAPGLGARVIVEVQRAFTLFERR